MSTALQQIARQVRKKGTAQPQSGIAFATEKREAKPPDIQMAVEDDRAVSCQAAFSPTIIPR